jgi:hypothetical protein
MSDVQIIHTDFGPRVEEEYLGDAVYASHDSLQIWLRTGDSNNQQIALDQSTYRALVEYAKRIGFDRRLEQRP